MLLLLLLFRFLSLVNRVRHVETSALWCVAFWWQKKLVSSGVLGIDPFVVHRNSFFFFSLVKEDKF